MQSSAELESLQCSHSSILPQGMLVPDNRIIIQSQAGNMCRFHGAHWQISSVLSTGKVLKWAHAEYAAVHNHWHECGSRVGWGPSRGHIVRMDACHAQGEHSSTA